MTKKENVLEKCRINLDKEKFLHSITRGEKEELQERIDKVIKCLNYYTCNKEFLSVEEQELYEILSGKEKIKVVRYEDYKRLENIIKEVREYIEQLLKYKNTNKVIHKEYIERIIDIINQDKRY